MRNLDFSQILFINDWLRCQWLYKVFQLDPTSDRRLVKEGQGQQSANIAVVEI